MSLGIGGSFTLNLELNVTEFAPCSLVNRVMVCAMNGEECVAGAAYHVRECGELPWLSAGYGFRQEGGAGSSRSGSDSLHHSRTE